MCVSVHRSECALNYFLSFAQIEKKNEQAGKEKTYHGSAAAFIFYRTVIAGIVPLRYRTFFPCFRYVRNSEHLRATRMWGRRGEKARVARPPVSPEGGAQAGFTLLGRRGCRRCSVCLQSLWPAWGQRNRTVTQSHNPSARQNYFLLLFVCFPFLLFGFLVHV